MADAQDVKIIGADPGLDLQALTGWVQGREQTLAPVVAISLGEGADGKTQTAVSFDLNRDTLTAKFATVKLLVGGAPVVGPNETLVCKGKAYVSNAETGVFLVRPK
jgi:hypothetical protein